MEVGRGKTMGGTGIRPWEKEATMSCGWSSWGMLVHAGFCLWVWFDCGCDGSWPNLGSRECRSTTARRDGVREREVWAIMCSPREVQDTRRSEKAKRSDSWLRRARCIQGEEEFCLQGLNRHLDGENFCGFELEADWTSVGSMGGLVGEFEFLCPIFTEWEVWPMRAAKEGFRIWLWAEARISTSELASFPWRLQLLHWLESITPPQGWYGREQYCCSKCQSNAVEFTRILPRQKGLSL